MPKKYIFSVPGSLEGLADSPHCEAHLKELRRAEALFNRGDPVPRSLKELADAILAQKSAVRMRDTGLPYMECVHEMQRRYPCLRFATAPYLPDGHFSAISFTTQEDDHHADA